MFMMLLGIFWFGQAFSIYGAITRAAQEGARAGSVPIAPPAYASAPDVPPTNAVNAVQAAMIASKLDPTQARCPVDHRRLLPACTGSSNACATSQLEYLRASSGRIVQRILPAATGVCGISVSFQYPFQFWLPFTSLNKQKIWIDARRACGWRPIDGSAHLRSWLGRLAGSRWRERPRRAIGRVCRRSALAGGVRRGYLRLQQRLHAASRNSPILRAMRLGWRQPIRRMIWSPVSGRSSSRSSTRFKSSTII